MDNKLDSATSPKIKIAEKNKKFNFSREMQIKTIMQNIVYHHNDEHLALKKTVNSKC